MHLNRILIATECRIDNIYFMLHHDFENVVSRLTQTWIVITSSQLISHQTEFSLVPLQSKKTHQLKFQLWNAAQFSETTFDYI